MTERARIPAQATADLCDRLGDAARVPTPQLRHFGRRRTFAGPVSTVQLPPAA